MIVCPRIPRLRRAAFAAWSQRVGSKARDFFCRGSRAGCAGDTPAATVRSKKTEDSWVLANVERSPRQLLGALSTQSDCACGDSFWHRRQESLPFSLARTALNVPRLDDRSPTRDENSTSPMIKSAVSSFPLHINVHGNSRVASRVPRQLRFTFHHPLFRAYGRGGGVGRGLGVGTGLGVDVGVGVAVAVAVGVGVGVGLAQPGGT